MNNLMHCVQQKPIIIILIPLINIHNKWAETSIISEQNVNILHRLYSGPGHFGIKARIGWQNAETVCAN